MLKQNYEVQITVNGKPLREYYYDHKYYVEAREGSEFQIKIKNNSFERVVAIPAVDGLSILDGEKASYDSRGYIINAYDSITIDGWRVNDKEVAKFYFTKDGDSYSVKLGKGKSNLGIIGVVIFPEKAKLVDNYVFVETWKNPSIPLWPYPNDTTSTTCSISSVSTFTCSSGEEQERCSSKIGTGWGEYKKSEVQSVGFEREDSGVEFNIYYASKKDLQDMGITLEDKPKYITPQAFPGNSYCKPPKK